MTTINPKTQERLDWLAARGVIPALCYGPLGRWSVYVMYPGEREYSKVQQAESFDHAVEVAVWTAINLEYAAEPVP